MANEKRLIDANYLVCKMIPNCPIGEGGIPLKDFDNHQKILKLYPTIDAVEVVRCKDCKKYSVTYRNNLLRLGWCMRFDNAMQDDAFCSYGERKDGSE